MDEDSINWLNKFQAEHGRPLRILHIGNIANNAYLNSKILRRIGVESDVLCYDYYHIMGCPEWEDADFSGDWGDDFSPNWDSVNLNGFKRPTWFVQKSILDGLRYVQNGIGHVKDGDERGNIVYYFIKRLGGVLRYIFFRYRDAILNSSVLIGVEDKFKVQYIFIQRLINLVKRCANKLNRIVGYYYENMVVNVSYLDKIVHRFPVNFPDRGDKLSILDLSAYIYIIKDIKRSFQYYDLVHAYATDGIYPLLVDKPYVAYEHGTIRGIPYEKNTQGRLCALTYREADCVAITNCDAVESAKSLGIVRYEFVPHPVNEDWLGEDNQVLSLKDKLKKTLDSDFIIFHPSRQHWDSNRDPSLEKGNDYFIKGFARFIQDTNHKASCVMVEWGGTLKESKELIDKLGISERIMWIKPQPNRNMIRYIMATDALADQFYLGAFGSTTPKALALGKPVLLYLNEEVHKWCFDTLPPVLNVQTPEQIYKELSRIYKNPSDYELLSFKGIEWYKKYHSNKVIEAKLLGMYQRVLKSRANKQV